MAKAPPDMERWAPVQGWQGVYAVSTLGNIRRLKGGKGARLGQILRPWISGATATRTGYPAVDLGGRRYYVHALVAEAFLPPRPTPKHEINHIDGDKQNRAASNLEWCTRRENILHAFANGLKANPADRTHCPSGHAYDSENTYRDRNGYRHCRACINAASRRYRARRKEASLGA